MLLCLSIIPYFYVCIYLICSSSQFYKIFHYFLLRVGSSKTNNNCIIVFVATIRLNSRVESSINSWQLFLFFKKKVKSYLLVWPPGDNCNPAGVERGGFDSAWGTLSSFEFWLLTKSWNHLSFVNISPTLVIDTSMEWSSRVLHHGNPKMWKFFKKFEIDKIEFCPYPEFPYAEKRNRPGFVNISPT